jgi:hypothetical protein
MDLVNRALELERLAPSFVVSDWLSVAGIVAPAG